MIYLLIDMYALRYLYVGREAWVGGKVIELLLICMRLGMIYIWEKSELLYHFLAYVKSNLDL